MKPIGNFNRLPKGFKQPEKLQKGQTVTYRLHEDFRKKVIISRDGAMQERWPESIQIPTRDVILINYTENGEEKSDLFDIGLINKVDRDGTPDVEPFWLEANVRKGEWTLTGGSIDDEKLYWYFELCNYNGSNPDRDQAKKIYFYKVDHEGEAKQANRLVDLELECLLFIKNCTPKEIKKLAAAFQYNENEPESVLRKKLNDFAKKDPEQFNKLATSKSVEIKATIQRAFNHQVIKYNPQQHKVTWSDGSTICSLTRVEGIKWQEQFADWIQTHKNGTGTYNQIDKLLQPNNATV
jgi:hypothetical protein